MLIFRCPTCQTLLADKQLIWEKKLQEVVLKAQNDIDLIETTRNSKCENAKTELECDNIINNAAKEIEMVKTKQLDVVEKLIDNIGLTRLCCRMRLTTYVPLIEIVK